MATFAKVNEQHVVEILGGIDSSFFNTFIDSSPGNWIEVTSSQKNSPTIGVFYDSQNDVFAKGSLPFPSWTLNSSTGNWTQEEAYPDDGKYYTWDETSTSWKEQVK